MDFGSAINHVQTATLAKEQNNNPKGFRLPNWQPDVIIRVQKPDENSKMTEPYFYVDSIHGRFPWIPNMIEMFSNKWELVK